jgi:hypothetical protein
VTPSEAPRRPNTKNSTPCRKPKRLSSPVAEHPNHRHPNHRHPNHQQLMAKKVMEAAKEVIESRSRQRKRKSRQSLLQSSTQTGAVWATAGQVPWEGLASTLESQIQGSSGCVCYAAGCGSVLTPSSAGTSPSACRARSKQISELS